jgi:hypothetical protein
MNKPIQPDLLPLDTPIGSKTLGEFIEADDFEKKLWNADSAEMVIKSQPAIAVYDNNYGDIVVRMEADYPDEDPIVRVRPENLRALITALQRYLPR